MQPDNFDILEIVMMLAALILLFTYFCLLFEMTHHLSSFSVM